MIDLTKYKNVHCIGIGGIGLSAIAEILLSRGYNVSGSDMKESDMTDKLARMGARIYLGHRAENVENADILVFSAAVAQDNPELVKALMGLCGGVGFSGGCCGCMTAGTCMISYLTGKGSDAEQESADHKPMMKEFTEWFKERMVPEFGSINCCDVIHFDPAKRIEMCPPIIADTYEKCVELLQEKDLL